MRSLEDLLQSLRLGANQVRLVTLIDSRRSPLFRFLAGDPPAWIASSYGAMTTVSDAEARLLLDHGALAAQEG